MLLVVGLTGLASSGKGEVSKYLTSKYNFKKLVFSDVVREEAKKRGLLKDKTYEEEKYVLSKLGETLRKGSGKWDILAEKLVEKIKKGEFEKTVVDGFRSVEEVNLFRREFEKFYLIYINTDEKTRFLRRKAEDATATIENLRKRDQENIEIIGLGNVIKMADFTIDNLGSLEDLNKQLDKILKTIIGQDIAQLHFLEKLVLFQLL